MDRLPPNAPLVDTHANLVSPEYDSERVEVVARARKAALAAIVGALTIALT